MNRFSFSKLRWFVTVLVLFLTSQSAFPVVFRNLSFDTLCESSDIVVEGHLVRASASEVVGCWFGAIYEVDVDKVHRNGTNNNFQKFFFEKTIYYAAPPCGMLIGDALLGTPESATDLDTVENKAQRIFFLQQVDEQMMRPVFPREGILTILPTTQQKLESFNESKACFVDTPRTRSKIDVKALVKPTPKRKTISGEEAKALYEELDVVGTQISSATQWQITHKKITEGDDTVLCKESINKANGSTRYQCTISQLYTDQERKFKKAVEMMREDFLEGN